MKNERRESETSVVDAASTCLATEGFRSSALLTGKSLNVLLYLIITNSSIFFLN